MGIPIVMELQFFVKCFLQKTGFPLLFKCVNSRAGKAEFEGVSACCDSRVRVGSVGGTTNKKRSH